MLMWEWGWWSQLPGMSKAICDYVNVGVGWSQLSLELYLNVGWLIVGATKSKTLS